MNYEDILRLLKKYNITTLDELEYYLNAFDSDDECIDDPEDNKKNCTNAQCYEYYFVPDCRKIIEIYKKYFQNNISTKKEFIKYLGDNIEKSISSMENYMSCKSCNQQIKKGIQNSLKISDSEFKKDFCNNLTVKFNYTSLFETDYISIKQFLTKEHQITEDNFMPIYNKEDSMTKEEERKLFHIVHTSKNDFKINIQKKENLIGSDKYIFNLAQYAFDRNLIDECNMLLNKLSKASSEYLQKEEFIHLKAKVLSSLKQDKEAIIILKKLIDMQKPKLDAETQNILAASIKRDAFNQYKHYGDEVALIKNLAEAKEIYHSIYNLNHDYYPALNYIYLNYILAYITAKDDKYFTDLKRQAKDIWKNTDHKITDWWSFISNIEFLILIGDYNQAHQQLKLHFNELDEEDITEFNISSTLRQLELYQEFCNDIELKNIIEFINNIYT